MELELKLLGLDSYTMLGLIAISWSLKFITKGSPYSGSDFLSVSRFSSSLEGFGATKLSFRGILVKLPSSCFRFWNFLNFLNFLRPVRPLFLSDLRFPDLGFILSSSSKVSNSSSGVGSVCVCTVGRGSGMSTNSLAIVG